MNPEARCRADRPCLEGSKSRDRLSGEPRTVGLFACPSPRTTTCRRGDSAMKLFWLLALVGCVPGGHGNHMTQPPPPNPNATVSGVAWCGTQFVAVAALGGTGGIVITSRDGIVWTAKALGTFGLRGVASAGSPSAAVAVGAAGTIVSSPDGVAWTTQTSGTSVDLNWVAWSGTEFVAVGSLCTLLTSPDAVTWTARASGTLYATIGVAWQTTASWPWEGSGRSAPRPLAFSGRARW